MSDISTPTATAATTAAPQPAVPGEIAQLKSAIERLEHAILRLGSREEHRILTRLNVLFHTPYGAMAGLIAGLALGLWAYRLAASVSLP